MRHQYHQYFTDRFIALNNRRMLFGVVIQPRYIADRQKQDSCHIAEESCQKTSICEAKNLPLIKADRAKDVLLDIYNRFDIASVQRASDLDLSAEASNKIYKYIEKEQLAEGIFLNITGKRGGLSKYHILTKKGYEFIEKSPVKQSGGTGSKHHFIQRYLKKHLASKGFQDLVIEKDLGKRIDLFGTYQELKIAIEICISTIRTEHLNVQKDFDKCDLLFIACPDKKTKHNLEKAIYKKISPNPKLKICLVHELLNKPDELIEN